MNFILGKFYTIFYKIRNGFVFIPSLIIFLIFGAGIFLISLEAENHTDFIKNLPFIKIHELGTLRSILTTFLTGLISITVFSFSMVMLVLSQASSNYSPRILNWMVNEKGNQYILGFFLGTIVLTILLLLQLPENKDAIPTFHFAVSLDALLTFYCLILFVSFINRVSNDIQITHITENIFIKTSKKLKEDLESENLREEKEPQSEHWEEYKANVAGYLQKVRLDKLVEILVEKDLKIRIKKETGYYYLSESPLFSLNKKISDKKILHEIESTFVFYSGERIQDHAFFGFKQLSEIAVKSLSPGINDPVTANQCIDYLTHLFCIRMEQDLPYIKNDAKGIERVIFLNYTVDQLLTICMIPILQYGSKDLSILSSLITFLQRLGIKDHRRKYQAEFNLFLQGVLVEVEKFKDNEYLYNHFPPLINSLRKIDGNYFFNFHLPGSLLKEHFSN